MMSKRIFILALPILLLISCREKDSKGNNVSQGYLDSLKEVSIGGIYSISIPSRYGITKEEGPDFTVSYFADTDTTAKLSFLGGIYFGGHPSLFPARNKNCKAETIDSEIFEKNQRWSMYDCDSTFSVQAIVSSESNQEWRSQIHAFGSGRNRADVNNILAIFSTLQKKERDSSLIFDPTQ